MADQNNESGVTWHQVDHNIVVWLTEWRTYGFLLYEGAHYSTVSFRSPQTGERIIEQIENDEYELWGDWAIDYNED